MRKSLFQGDIENLEPDSGSAMRIDPELMDSRFRIPRGFAFEIEPESIDVVVVIAALGKGGAALAASLERRRRAPKYNCLIGSAAADHSHPDRTDCVSKGIEIETRIHELGIEIGGFPDGESIARFNGFHPDGGPVAAVGFAVESPEFRRRRRFG